MRYNARRNCLNGLQDGERDDMETEWILKLLAAAGACIAMVTDMRTGKIFNWLTFPMILGGWILNLAFFGLAGFGWSFLAFWVGILLYTVPAAVGAVGMGDVKLLAGIGALAGSRFVIGAFLFTSIVGIPHALGVYYLNHGRNFLTVLATSYTSGGFRNLKITPEGEGPRWKFYLGPDIFLGCLLSWYFPLMITW